jgi:hypothetical protein
MAIFRSSAGPLAMLLLAPFAAAQPVCYQLGDAASGTVECQTSPADGSFSLELTDNAGTVLTYTITGVQIVVHAPGGSHTLTGDGTYTRISGFAGWDHEMSLMLSVDGAAPVAFDSGHIRGGAEFPNVTISIQTDAGGCDGFVLDLTAAPGGDCDAHCPCELTGDQATDVFDLLAYLDDWFAGSAAAELDGTPGIDVFDLLAYLDCWFSASAGNPCG